MGWSQFEDGRELFVGDEAFDIMGETIDEINSLYIKTFNRNVTREELVEIFEFCCFL